MCAEAAAVAARLPGMAVALQRVVLTGEGIFSSWLNTLADLHIISNNIHADADVSGNPQ